MKRMSFLIMVPAVFNVLFFLHALLPVTVLGCRTRGFIALIIAFLSILFGLFTAATALKKRIRREQDSAEWIMSSLLSIIPVIALLILG